MESSWHGASIHGTQTRGFLQQRWLKILLLVLGILFLLLLILPFFINADTFRPTAEGELSTALGRRVTLGHLSLSLFSGSLVADNIAIADDPAFSSTPFLQAKYLHIGVDLGALLFSHQLHIDSFTANAPQIHLISKPNGGWNYASLGSGSSSAGSSSGSAPDLSIGDFKIADGSVDVSSIPAQGAPFVYNHVDIDVKNVSFTSAMPFTISADLPANGTVKLNGTAGPVARPNAVDTPLQASIQIDNFNPVAAGVIPPSDGVSMIAALDAKLDSNGKTLTVAGNLKASQLKLSAQGTPAPQPVNLDLHATSNLGAQTGQIDDLAIHTGAMAAHVTGTYQVVGQAVNLNLHLAAPGLPVDGLEQLLPALGIKLPSGSSLHGGTLTAQLDITGPAAGPRVAGPVSIDNTELAGFSLGSRIQGLTSNLGSATSNGTQIQKVSANVVNTPQGTQLNQIDCVVPAIGTATGNGAVAASGALNFNLLAKLSTTGIGGAASSVINGIGGTLGSFLHSAVSNGIPISVTGTSSDPHIMANIGAMFKGNGAQSSGSNTSKPSPGGILGGLLGGKN